MNHLPVLLKEAVEALRIKPDEWYLDGTFGRGGHTQAILDLGGKVIALDCDEEAIIFGKEKFGDKVIFIWENFEKIGAVMKELKLKNPTLKLSGALFDFGMSSPQLESQDRGFSFQHPDAQLDMRMDNRLGVQAKDLLAVLSEKQLSDLFFHEGGEAEARSVARVVAKVRRSKRIETVNDLLEVVTLAKHSRRSHLHPATKVFQALRIAVNREQETISPALRGTLTTLEPGARLVTISFHEGEDRVAKHTFRDWEKSGLGVIIDDSISPSPQEIAINPRSRSARLRVFEKGNL